MDLKLTMNRTRDRDAGLALSLIFLLVWLGTRLAWPVYAAMAVLALTMIWPPFMRPCAWLWFGLAIVLGAVVSKILLSVVWLVLVVPIGLARRLMGKDSLGLKAFGKKEGSFFAVRNHVYDSEDLKHPY